MGRTTFKSFVPRFYCPMPAIRPADGGAGTDTDTAEHKSLFRINTPWAGNPGQSDSPNELARYEQTSWVMLGATWACNATGAGGTHGININNLQSGMGAISLLEGASAVAISNTANQSGTIKGGFAPYATAGELTGDTQPASGRQSRPGDGGNWCFRGEVAATDTIDDLFGQLIVSPGRVNLDGTASINPWTPSEALLQTDFPGPVTGGYFPLICPERNSGTGTDVTVCEVEAPMDLRVHEVLFMYKNSAAGNTAKVTNQTDSVDITGDTSLTGTGANSTQVAAASLSNRNITKGDKIRILATASSTEFDSLCVVLHCHPKGHFHTDDARRDIVSRAAGSTEGTAIERALSSHHGPRTNFSGPCTGGIYPLYFPGCEVADLATGTNVAVSELVVPFDCQPLWGYAAHSGSASGNSWRLQNTTDAVTIITEAGHVAATAEYDTYDTVLASAGGGNEILDNGDKLDKGDVIQLQASASTTQYTRLGAVLYVVVLGHINADVRDD